MRALIVTQASEGSLTGNRRTAERWAGILTGLGHAVDVAGGYESQPCDLMIALHATKSAGSIARFHSRRRSAPLLVAVTGTDLYGDLPHSEATRQSLEKATRVIALQPHAVDELAPELRPRVRVIRQSVRALQDVAPPAKDAFEICVVGHLRPVKDPFRTAAAARLLPAASRVRVLHAGAALEPAMERQARDEQLANRRYRWLGALPPAETLRLIARSRLLVLTSLMEGGAHVIGEAAVHGVAILSSHIAGSTGLLGDDHPGTFPVGDTASLAALIRRAEDEPLFLAELEKRSRRIASLFSPEREGQAWKELLADLTEQQDDSGDR